MNTSAKLGFVCAVVATCIGASEAPAQYYYGYAYTPSDVSSLNVPPSVSYYAPAYGSPFYAPDVQGRAPFVGNSYSFYGPAYTSSYYTPVYSATQSLGYQTTPHGAPLLYAQPGPYFYTPGQSYTPTYYGYYYSPRFFRY